MGAATIGAGGHYPPPCKGGSRGGGWSKYTVDILYACNKCLRTDEVFHLLTDYSVACVYGFVQREYCLDNCFVLILSFSE